MQRASSKQYVNACITSYYLLEIMKRLSPLQLAKYVVWTKFVTVAKHNRQRYTIRVNRSESPAWILGRSAAVAKDLVRLDSIVYDKRTLIDHYRYTSRHRKQQQYKRNAVLPVHESTFALQVSEVSQHLHAASSSCSQLCNPQVLWSHSVMDDSFPLHITSSKRIGPLPEPHALWMFTPVLK